MQVLRFKIASFFQSNASIFAFAGMAIRLQYHVLGQIVSSLAL